MDHHHKQHEQIDLKNPTEKMVKRHSPFLETDEEQHLEISLHCHNSLLFENLFSLQSKR